MVIHSGYRPLFSNLVYFIDYASAQLNSIQLRPRVFTIGICLNMAIVLFQISKFKNSFSYQVYRRVSEVSYESAFIRTGGNGMFRVSPRLIAFNIERKCTHADAADTDMVLRRIVTINTRSATACRRENAKEFAKMKTS